MENSERCKDVFIASIVKIPPAPPLPSASSTATQPEKTSVSRIEQVQIATSGELRLSNLIPHLPKQSNKLLRH